MNSSTGMGIRKIQAVIIRKKRKDREMEQEKEQSEE